MKKKGVTPLETQNKTNNLRPAKAGLSLTGVTLVETLVVSVILVILVGILSASIMGINSIFETSDINVMLQADVRSAIDKMVFDLVRTTQIKIDIIQNDPLAGSDAIVYHLPRDSDGDNIPDINISSGNIIWDDADITIRLDSAGTQRLRREFESGNVDIIAQNVKKINFIDHKIAPSLYLDEIKIILELEKTTFKGRTFNTNSTSTVNMRN